MMMWLVLVALPITAASFILVQVIDTRLTQRVYAGLENDHRLEAARINAALDQYATYARSLSIRPDIRELLTEYAKFDQRNTADGSTIANSTFEQHFESRLVERAESMLKSALMLKSSVAELKILTHDEKLSGQTLGYTWQPTDNTLVSKSVESTKALFGNAFRNEQQHDRLGVIVPVFSTALAGEAPAQPLGFLFIEMALSPIVDLVEAHEGLGRTSESHIAQPTVDGDAEFITLLRFKRDAAFNIIVPKEKDKPINWSLESPEMRVVRSPDYRKVDSILAIGTIDSTGWGLVVKIDTEEAFTALAEVKRLIWFAAGISLMIILLSWLLMLRPLGRRLKDVNNAADKVARGNYGALIKDGVNDEIGALSKSINLLARELYNDQQLREDAECKLKYQAEHDALTGLFNRKHLQDVINRLDQNPGSLTNSILFLDLDGFKEINDTHGHHIGDEILVSVACELSKILPENGHSGRWGGDEFLVILEQSNEKQATQTAILIAERFDHPFETSAGPKRLGCSIDKSTTSFGTNTSSCVETADARMYERKQRPCGNSSACMSATSFVHESIKEDRVEVWYQPVVEATQHDNALIVGAEALLRTRDAQGNVVPPGEYLPQIQEEDISALLDRRVLSLVFNDIRKWRNLGMVEEDFYVNVNLSGPMVRQPQLPESLKTWLNLFSLPPQCIGLELSERTKNVDMDIIMALKATGLRLAVDDIGLHNSNLVRLAAVSPGMAKFDQIWVMNEENVATPQHLMSIEERKLIVLKNMLNVCSELGMQCIMEGIETEEQLQRLLSLGATRFQGYLFDAALPPDQFEEKLHNALPSLWINACQELRKAG